MDEHDEFECEDCVKKTTMVNNHHMMVVIPCPYGEILWLCESCQQSEHWPKPADPEAASQILGAFLHMHCSDHFALVVE